MSYEKTYKTLQEISKKVLGKDKNVFLIGGISAAIQTGKDLYRKNDDLDLMVEKEELVSVLKDLKELGYKVYDRRGIKTQNAIDLNGKFKANNHEIDVDSTDRDLLGIGVFTYERKNGTVTTHSYAYDEREKSYIGTKKVMPEELFDLMYSSETVEYKGMCLKTSSKEFVYLSKSRGEREKDKQDADVLQAYIGEKELKNIKRIGILEKRTKIYKERFNEHGDIIESIQEPTYADKVYNFIKKWSKQNSEVKPQELYEKLISDEQVQGFISRDDDAKNILEKIGMVKPKSVDEFANNARRITNLYCYSDNFEKDFEKEFLNKEKDNEDPMIL